jgi:hypothetical protein
MGLTELRDGIMPVELLLYQLPSRFEAAGKTFEATYTPIGDVEAPKQLLVIVSDVTDVILHERAERDQKELIALTDEVEILVATARNAEPDDRLVSSYPLMTMVAVLTAGWLMERMGRAIHAGEAEAGRGRRAAVEYFLTVIVPEALGLGAGAGAMAELFYRAPAEELA